MNDHHRLIIGLLKLFDLFLVVLAFALTTISCVHAEHTVTLGEFLSMRAKVSNLIIIFFALVVCHLVFTMCGLYRSRRLTGRKSEALDLLRATTTYITFFLALSVVFSIGMITIAFLAEFWVLTTCFLVASRFVLRNVADHVRTLGRDQRHMLIVGANARAMEFARRILASRERGYRLLGFVDGDWAGLDALKKVGFPVVSDYAGLEEYLRRNVVDEVAIYLPLGSYYKHCSHVANLCQQHGITMRIHADIFGVESTRWRPEDFEGDQYIATYTPASELWPRTVKRIFDVVVASLALVALLPVFALAAIAVKLSSSGPIFFHQQRIGLNKRRFKMLKFRSMVHNAEALMPALEKWNEASGPVFKIRNDPRITPVGQLLRRSSIDELPQLLNVLTGDMSLVGPRPLPVRDFDGFNEDRQRRRFSIKPGITCLWQVNGRSNLSFEQWMELDLKYLDEWSLWLDLKILTRTIPAVFRGAGAA
jgi:exopolysaccharide biosynthesis polyprenyl glycosylphosphotransferase